MLVNLDVWNGLSEQYRDLLDVACQANVAWSFAHGEAVQGEVIRNFPAEGNSAETLPRDILEELRVIANEVLDEEASKDRHFATILASQRAFSESYAYWKRKGYLPRDF